VGVEALPSRLGRHRDAASPKRLLGFLVFWWPVADVLPLIPPRTLNQQHALVTSK
jgi:hypothetical protein